MALKALLLRRGIDMKRAELEALTAKDADFQRREAELETAINEVNTAEEQAAVEAEVETFNAEKDAHVEAKKKLETELGVLETELEAEEAKQDAEPPAEDPAPEQRKERHGNMSYEMRYRELTNESRAAFVGREDVKSFLSTVRAAIQNKRAITNAGLTIPTVMLDMVRREVAYSSKLLPFVRLRNVSGKARQTIAGSIPTGVWTEAVGALNNLDLTFNQIEVDGYKVGGYIAVPNAYLEDSDVNLAGEIVAAIGGAIGKALDWAILFGTGTKMPVGIVTRLAQESQPASWDTNGPAWVDLHSTNIQTINIDATSGAAFFASLVEKLAIAQPVYSSEGLFWAMNRKTHLHLMAKALAFDAAGAMVAGTQLMPIVGGTVVEFDDSDIQDNTIYGGFGGNYLLAERAGMKLESSDLPLFIQDQTVFKGTARYDGKAIDGKAFVVVNFANTSPTTSKTFPTDWANTGLNELTLVAAASSSNVGKTKITVTDYLSSSTPVLYYKLGTQPVTAGEAIPVSGTGAWSSLTSGSTEITAAAGKKITVVELTAAAASGGVVCSAGVVASVPKTS